MEHVPHGGDLGGVPVADLLVERGGVMEHPPHVGDLRGVPSAYRLVERLCMSEQRPHVGDLGGIPVADRRVFTGAAVSAAAALGLGLAAVEAGGHRGEAVVDGGLERGAVGEGRGLGDGGDKVVAEKSNFFRSYLFREAPHEPQVP